MLIKTINNLELSSPFSYLSGAVASGGSIVPVRNINAFQASWAVQIGKTGEETSEVLVLVSSAPTGTAGTTTGTARFDHQVDTPIYATKFDKIVFMRSTTGTAGAASAMTDGTITITPDSQYTVFDDTTGALNYAYKTKFRNSVTTEESADSDWVTPAGFSFYSLAKIRQRVKDKLFGNNFIENDLTIDDWVNEWLERMTNTAISVNKDYSLGTVDVGFGTSGLGTITASDFKEVRRFWTTYDGVSYAQSTKVGINDFLPDETFVNTRPIHFFQGDNIFGIKPSGTEGTARIVYYKMNPVLVNDTDELPVSMRSYTKSFVDYGLSQARYSDEKQSFARDMLASAEAEIERFKQEITPRAKTGPQYITMTDAMTGEDGVVDLF